MGDYYGKHPGSCSETLNSGNLLDTSLKYLEKTSAGLRLSKILLTGLAMIGRESEGGSLASAGVLSPIHTRFRAMTLEPPPTLFANHVKLSKADVMNDMLQKRCIRIMKLGEDGFFSRAFLVPNKSGGFRLVIDLFQLHTYLAD